MKITNLYRYTGEDGTVDTMVKLPMEYESMYRLTAENGKVLTNGETVAKVIDIPVADLEKWSETKEPEVTEEGETE